MNQLIKKKYFLFSKLNYFLIIILPISILIGSMVSNITVALIGIFFICDLIHRRNSFFIKDKNFYFLIIIYIYLLINSVFISENADAPIKAFGFIRFILLSYAIYFYFKLFNNSFLKFWAIIFFIVSFDIIFEFFLGFNTLGFKSNYIGRISSFTGDELKIGGFYFGFMFICLSLFSQKKIFIPLMVIFFVICLMIGERSNLLKVSIMIFLYMMFFVNFSILKKTLSIIIIFFTIFLVANSSANLKAKYNFIGIFNISENFKNLQNNKDFMNSIIIGNTHLIHYKIAMNIFNQNPFFGKGFKTYRIESYNEKYFDKNFNFQLDMDLPILTNYILKYFLN